MMNEQVHSIYTAHIVWVEIAQLVNRVATVWTVRGSNPDGEIFRTRPERPGPYPASYKIGSGSLFRGLCGRVVALTTTI
jgi:hypothetical protein